MNLIVNTMTQIQVENHPKKNLCLLNNIPVYVQCNLYTKVATRDINFGMLIKNTPESRTRLALDITTTIKNNFGVHLPLPLFTL